MHLRRSSARLPGGFLALTVLTAWVGVPTDIFGQEPQLEAGLRVVEVVTEPGSVSLELGESAELRVRALDSTGAEVDALLRFAAPRPALEVGDDIVRAHQAGDFLVVATVVLPPDADRAPPSVEVPVRVSWPSVARVDVTSESPVLHEGTVVRHRARALLADETERRGLDVRWESDDPSIASVDRFGNVIAHRAGQVVIKAEVEGVRGRMEHEVTPFPATGLEILGDGEGARTGDVIHFRAQALDESGAPVEDLPLTWAYTYDPGETDIRTPGGAAEVDDGTFVAELPGIYTVLATAGPLTVRTSFEVSPRLVVQQARFEGMGRVDEYHTSDFWIFEGNDGRDYAISGTWGADGWAYMWDVTDPAGMVRTDSVRVDARTVNDVKVSPDARYATLTREGASDRRNGLVLLDLADPAHPAVAAEFDEGLTGGVHNAFPTNEYVYALSGGEKYLIIDVQDLENPMVVGEVQHENCRIHDVWVEDGIAYSAQWACGLLVYDVGNGRWGGTAEEPVFVSQYVTPGGRTHAVFPYLQEATGRFYVFLGDEIIGRGDRAWGGVDASWDALETEGGRLPEQTAGYTHIVDFTDPGQPRKVARYELPEYGAHNIWVEDDVLYQAYYEGGLRVVDVSGELRGNLATQGREISVFKPFDPAGFIRNAPMVWSGMPYKGKVFLSDHNSGLWSIQLQPHPEGRPVSRR